MAIRETIDKRGDRTYGVNVYDPTTQRTKWIGTYPDEMAARQAELDAMKETRRGRSPSGGHDLSVEELVAKWVEFARRPSTQEDYRNGGRFFVAYFRQRTVGSIVAEDFHRFASFMSSQRKQNDEPYAPRTVRKVVTQLYQVVNLAVELQYLDRSPAPKMKRLALPDVPPPRKVELSSEDAGRIIESMPEAWRDFPLLALATGMRRGELFSLRYRAVRWGSDAVEVIAEQSEDLSSTVKTRAAARVVPVPHGVIEHLRRRMADSGAEPDDLVFPNTLGKRMSNANFYRRIWVPATKRAGLEGLHLHDLRKALATHLAAAGRTPAYLEEVMGHRAYSTTMKYYTKVSSEEVEKGRGDVADWLGQEDLMPTDSACLSTNLSTMAEQEEVGGAAAHSHLRFCVVPPA